MKLDYTRSHETIIIFFVRIESHIQFDHRVSVKRFFNQFCIICPEQNYFKEFKFNGYIEDT